MSNSSPHAPRRAFAGALLLATLLLAPGAGAHAGGFADEVVRFTPGARAGFGADELPAIVLGPPEGTGDLQGSLDTLALGDGGSIVLAFRAAAICDRPGPDFTVFENAFFGGGTAIFAEVGVVAVSADGVDFVEFPYDPITFDGLAGTHPVYSNSDNGIDPLDPSVSGGDPFDLADVGLAAVAYVRITDPGAAIPDPGNRVPPGNSAGFDLDAIAALHTCDGVPPSATPSATPSADATAPSTRRSTPTPTAPRTPTPTRSGAPLRGDANGDGLVDAADLAHAIAEIFDGDGEGTAAAGGGLVSSTAGVDRNLDERVTTADLLPREP